VSALAVVALMVGGLFHSLGITWGYPWDLEPNATGVASGETVARHLTPVADDHSDRVAREALAELGVELPDDATVTGVDRLDFENMTGWSVDDATLVRAEVPRGALPPMLDRRETGLFFQTGNASELLDERELDMLGEPVAGDAPALSWPVPNVDPNSSGRRLAIVVPASDPVAVTFLIYEGPQW
jgi:hypothetical protein